MSENLRIYLKASGGEPFSNTYSIDFDGSNEYLTLADHSDFDFSRFDAFSLSAWIKTTETGWGIILSKMGFGVGVGWYFGYNQTPNIGTLFFGLINTWPSNRLSIKNGTATINDGNWHHVCVTKDTTSDAAGVTFYIDGAADSFTVEADTLSASPENDEPVNIGSRGDGGGGLVDGNVDEASVWDKELSSTEVDDIYNSGVPNDLADHSAASDLLGWWRMGDGDNGSGTDDSSDSTDSNARIYDMSENSHNMTPENTESGDIVEDVPE